MIHPPQQKLTAGDADLDAQNKVALQANSQTACTRAIAADAEVSLENAAPARKFALAQLQGSEPEPLLSRAAWNHACERGSNDATALTFKYHNAELHQLHKPLATVSGQLFDEMERVRCLAVGTGWMLGVSRNLEALWRGKQAQRQDAQSAQTDQLVLVFSFLTRRSLGLPNSLTESAAKIVDQWQEPIVSATADYWSHLAQVAGDQSSFAHMSLKIIARINEHIDATPQSDNTSPANPKAPPEDNEASEKTDKDTKEENTDNDDSATEDPDLYNEEEERSEILLTEDQNTVFDEDNTRNRDAPVDAESESYGTAEELAPTPYTSYSNSFDEIVNANNLYTADERDTLRKTLDEHIERHSRVVGRLAGQLQRLLLANQNRHWKFDLEEGLLDASRLTRLVTQPYSGLSFKQESELEFKDTVVTILVDNSKSMLGKPIAIAAACTDILSQTLERCGISVEILGFTTTELHGGPLFNQWKADGKSSEPGRLNGLRHIIYKPADVPYRRARSGFGLMLHKDLLKQNIDGEALLWATERLQRRPEERRILLIISDGAPIDTSTMSANRDNYLIDHLHKVIDAIQTHSNIELTAIGIGHDVSAYYERSITIRDAKDLGKTLLTQFRSLFAKTK